MVVRMRTDGVPMRVRAGGVVLAASLAALASVPAGAAQPVRIDGFAARVNARVITVGDVRREMAPAAHRLRLRYSGAALEARLEQAYDRALQDLIERFLLAAEFDRRELTLPERAVDAEIGRLAAELFEGSRGALLEALAAEGMTIDQLRDQTREELKARLLFHQEVMRRAVVPPGDVRAAYTARAGDWEQPARVRLRAMEFAGGEAGERLARAADAIARLEAGESFAEVAREISDGRHAERGGDWGWMPLADLHETLREAIAPAAVGETAGPVALADRVFLLRVRAREEAGVRTLREAYPELAAAVQEAEAERLREELHQRLERRHVVQVIGDEAR